MNIAVYGIPFPEGMAMTNRLKMYLKALNNNEIKLKVYSVDDKISYGNYESIDYEIIQKKKIIQRHIDAYYIYALIHALNVWKISKNYDILFISRFGWVTVCLIWIVCGLNGCRIVMELNENPGSSGGSRLFPEWLRRFHRFIALNVAFRLLDGFICISKPLEELAKKYKKKSAKTLVIPILCDSSSYKLQKSEIKSKTQSTYIFHPGFIDPQKDGIYSVFEAFALACKRTDVSLRFILTVRTAQQDILDRIDNIIKKYQIEDRVEWLGFISSEEIKKYRENAAMGIVNKPKNWQNDFNFPTKLGDFLSSGIPVIASSTGEMNRYLIDGKTAYMVEANNVEQIANKIIEIAEYPERARIIGENGRKLADKNFDYRNYSTLLFEFFNDINQINVISGI